MISKYAWIAGGAALGVLLALGIGTARSSGGNDTSSPAAAAVGGARAGSGETDRDIDHEDVRKLRQAGKVVSLEELIEKTRRMHPGRLLEAELEKDGDRYIYELEYVDDAGTVWEFKYDAHTGKLLGKQHED